MRRRWRRERLGRHDRHPRHRRADHRPGAATLDVFVGGDTDKSYNARMLGVSECNDLALMDINESEPLPTFDCAAGYPLGDPEFTLTRCIIAKAQAGGDLTGTSSIDHTVPSRGVHRRVRIPACGP